MRTRRTVLASLATLAAVPALAQGKKAGGSNSAPDVLPISGSYDAYGRNPDGSEYNGTAQIVQQGEFVDVTWSISGDTNGGDGRIEGRIVTVDWGDDTPVVYVVMPDGSLHGTWADGTAFEKLTRQ